MPTEQQEEQAPEQPPDPNDPNNIVIESTPPAQPPRQQRSGGEPPQVFTNEDVERIRQEERARYAAEQQRADALQNELAQFRQAEEERTKAEEKVRKDSEKAAKKKEEEEMELRELITRKDQEWEQRLADERAEREKALAVLEQERRHSILQNYLAQRMLQDGDRIVPQLRGLVAGNSEEEIDAKIQELVGISESILGDTTQFLQQQNAARPMVGVTSPPIGPPDMAASTRVLTPDDIKGLTAEEYAANRDDLLRAASRSRRQ